MANYTKIVYTLTTSKVLSFDKTQKKACFILPCAHLFVPLHRFCKKTLEHK